MATKPDKLAVITALHLIKTKFDNPKAPKLREKSARRDVDAETVRSLMFDSNTVWSNLSVFRIETLMEEMRRLEDAPDFYSEAVDNILDDLDDFSSSGEDNCEDSFEAEVKKEEERAEISKEIEYEKSRMLKSSQLLEASLNPAESRSRSNAIEKEATCETELLPEPPIPPEQHQISPQKVTLSEHGSPQDRKSSSSSLEDEKDPWADENVARRPKEELVGKTDNRNSLEEFLQLEQELEVDDLDTNQKEEPLPLTMIELMHRERMSTLIEESDDEMEEDQMPNLSIIDEETIDSEILSPEFDLSEFTKALDFSKDLLKDDSKEDDNVSLSDSDREFEEMERLASLESEDAFNQLNEKEAQKTDSCCQSNDEKLAQEPVNHEYESQESGIRQSSPEIEKDDNCTSTSIISPGVSDTITSVLHNNESQYSYSSAADVPQEDNFEVKAGSVSAMDPTRVSFPDQEASVEDFIKASHDILPPPLVSKSSNDPAIEDSIEFNLAGESGSIVSSNKLIHISAQDDSIEDSIEAFVTATERKGSFHDAPEIRTFIDQERNQQSTTPHDSSTGLKVEPEESSKNPFDDDEASNSSSPEPVYPQQTHTLAPASQAEDILSRLKDTTEIDVDSIKYENFSNTSSDQAIDVRPSSSANDADSSDGDLERLAVKIDESGNVMDSDGESSIEMVDEEEKTKRAETMKQEELIHKKNEEKFMILLQQLTDREAQILEEQDEVDDRAKTVETDLRLAMKQDQRKEAELTGEWLALVQKRDDLLKSGSLIGLQRSRAKLELEYLHVQRQCRILSLKHEYEKTEEDRNLEENLIQQCVQLVSNKAIIEDDMATLEEEIQDQRERHAVQMQKNLMEQERQKQAETSTSIFGIKRSWFS